MNNQTNHKKDVNCTNTLADQHISNYLNGYISTIKNRILNKSKEIKIKTGIVNFDLKIDSYKPGQIILLASNTELLNKSLAISIVINNSIVGTSVMPSAYFFNHTGAESILDTLLCSISEIDINRIRTGDVSDWEWNRLYHSFEYIHQSLFHMIDATGIKSLDSINTINYFKNGTLTKFIIIDDFRLSNIIGNIRSHKRLEIFRDISMISKKLNVPCFVLVDSRYLVNNDDEINSVAEIVIDLNIQHTILNGIKSNDNSLLPIQMKYRIKHLNISGSSTVLFNQVHRKFVDALPHSLRNDSAAFEF
jgi:replicative DNA helicase